ncbi:MAG: nucleoside triphosphate pyrophosphohydrolase [Candidatus Methylacidiphilales bacterium]
MNKPSSDSTWPTDFKDPMDRLRQIVARLRGPDGCPWDQEQTHQSIRNLLLEECHEVLEAIDDRDDSALCEELGDVLLHVIFHAQLAGERSAFDLNDVLCTINEKLIRRHPHVFAVDQESPCKDTDAVLRQWDELKKMEKPERSGLLDGIPPSLPALMRARELQKKAARAGFDWEDPMGVLEKVREELDEFQDALCSGNQDDMAGEMGDLLFSLVNLARHLDIDAEEACRLTNRKFEKRFRHMEQQITASGRSLSEASLDEMEAHWQQAKALP